MDDTINSELFSFDSPLEQPSYIKVIGVGGGGNNAVNHMYRKGITGVDFIVSNTDMKALNGSPVPNKLVLGHEGLGVGGRPEKARRAAEERSEEIKELLSHNTKMVFITAGMGGGTGTGAAPVIAKLAKEINLPTEDEDDPGKILVVAVVTTPFMFEGNRRLQQAQAGVEELKKNVDSILVINNEKLRSYGNLCMSDAFSMANDVLLTAVKGIAEIITLNAYVNIDFRDVNTVMEHSGTAIMGIGTGKGENRALQAVEQAATSVLLNDSNIHGAKNVLLYFSYGPEHEITMDEMGVVADYITEHTGSRDTNVIWGTGTDESLNDEVKITLIATGFNETAKNEPEVHVLESDKPKPTAPVTPVETIDEITIIHREEPSTTPVTPDTPVDQGVVNPPLDSYVAPVVTPVETPAVDTLNVEPSDNTNRRVIPLYGDEETEPQEPVHREEGLDEGFHLINRSESTPSATVEPVAEPAPATVETVEFVKEPDPAPVVEKPTPVAFASPALDNETRARAERIKRMNDLLRNNVNGAQIVEAMNPMELTGERLYELTHSSQSNVSHSYLDANGKIKQNTELFGNKD